VRTRHLARHGQGTAPRRGRRKHEGGDRRTHGRGRLRGPDGAPPGSTGAARLWEAFEQGCGSSGTSKGRIPSKEQRRTTCRSSSQPRSSSSSARRPPGRSGWRFRTRCSCRRTRSSSESRATAGRPAVSAPRSRGRGA
jgi:hypothetical protein